MKTPLTALLIMLIAACAHRPASDNCVEPVARVRYCLLPPAAIVTDPLPRLITVKGPDTELEMVSQLTIDNGQLLLSAVSLLGQPLFEIRYDETGELQLLPSDAPVRADWLLAMLQLATAELVAVNGAMEGAFMEENGADRRLLSGNRVLMEINSRPNEMEVRVPERRLVIRMTRLDAETVQP